MKKLTKKDLIYIWIIVLSFLSIVFIISNISYFYGSQLDWLSQHVTIPEYFRSLFYKTKNLFPDFAFNIGGGQNIYNFSYYGLLSPIILFSYLFPQVSMINYIIISTVISVIAASIMLYTFLRKKDYSSEVCLLSVFLFITSSSLTLHSHRHIMFVNYMPFLILGLFGVDKKLEKNKGWLLSISVFLMIMTSYYFSISGIITLIVYGIYKYLKSKTKVTLKSFFQTGFSFLMPFLVGVVSSCIIILPTFATLLNNRAASNVTITLKDLINPFDSTSNLLYDTYGVGLTAISVIALVNFFKKKKENIFLGITLSTLVIIPLSNYLLNGTMYIDSKSLIPFLPLYIFTIAEFINNLFDNKIDFKKVLLVTLIISIIIYLNYSNKYYYLIDLAIVLASVFIYKKTNRKALFIIPVLLSGFIISLSINKSDNLVLKEKTINDNKEIKEHIDTITANDSSFYRIANDNDISETTNKIYDNLNYYQSTIYSSISNQDYNHFYYDIINNNIPSRNRVLTVTTGNIMFLNFSNNKYIVSRNKPLQGYEFVDTKEGINIYKNDNVLPLGFATSNVMNYEEFEKMTFAAQEEALLNVIVTDNNSNNNFATSVKEENLDFKDILKEKDDVIIHEQDGTITINTKDTIKITHNLSKEYQNKIIFIRFKMNHKQTCSEGDQIIRINNIKNKLTCKSWKYYNKNEVFDYVLAEQDLKTLTISISEGQYNLGDFQVFTLDPASLDNISSRIDPLNVDTTKTVGDKIVGDINVTKDGYFMLSVPFDKGFNISVDGKLVSYEKVDYSFIGFAIPKGEHHIEIEYKAPFKAASVSISLFGFLMFAIITILEAKRTI